MANELTVYKKNLNDPKFGIYVDLAKIEKMQYGSYDKVKSNCTPKKLERIGDEGCKLSMDEFYQICDDLAKEN